MEQETDIEPATRILEDCPSIENKEQVRSGKSDAAHSVGKAPQQLFHTGSVPPGATAIAGHRSVKKPTAPAEQPVASSTRRVMLGILRATVCIRLPRRAGR